MLKRKRHKKSGKYSPLRGIRVPRKRRFGPVLETESGVKVRSQYEKRCADYLFRNEIKFQYEPLMLLGGRQFRPDFFLPEYNLFLEICGYGHMPFYRDHTAHKQLVYRERGLQSIFLHYEGKGSLETKIRTELARFGVEFRVD
jgi:hypothetical protein